MTEDEALVHLKLLGYSLIEGTRNQAECFYFRQDETGKSLIYSTTSLTKIQAIRRMYLILEMFAEMEETHDWES